MKYQNIRENLIDHVVDDVKAMGTERVEVRLELRYAGCIFALREEKSFFSKKQLFPLGDLIR